MKLIERLLHYIAASVKASGPMETDEVAYYTVKGSGLRMDNVNEWMHQFFEKLVKANEKYCPAFYQGE